MKKVLLFLLCALVSIGTRAQDEILEGKSKVNFADEIFTVIINKDPGLSQVEGSFDNLGNAKKIIIKGTSINQDGLDKLHSKYWCNYDGKVIVDLTGSSIEGTLNDISDRYGSMIFAPGTILPSAGVLSTGEKLKYAYSADDPTKEGIEINLYVGTATSLDDIPELKDLLNNTTDKNSITVNLSGDENQTIKKLLTDQGVTVQEPVKPAEKGVITVTLPEGKRLSDVIPTAIEENGCLYGEIKFLTVESGDINQNDLLHIGENMPALEKLNLRNVTYTGELNFYEAFTEKDENGVRVPLLPNFKGLYFPDAMTELPDRFFNNSLKKLYAINNNIVYIWSQRDDAGNGNALNLDIVSDYLGNAEMRVRVFGPLTKADIGAIDGAFHTSKHYNFYGAKFVYGSGETFETFAEALAVKRTEEGYRAMNSILFPKGTTVEELKTTVLKHFCNEYVIADDVTRPDGTNAKTLYVIAREGNRLETGLARYETMDENIETAVIFAGKTAHEITWDSFLDALDALRKVKILDLSRLGELYTDEKKTFLTTDKNLAEHSYGTDCSVEIIKLPAHCPIHDSWYSDSSIPVVMRTHGLENNVNSVWKNIYGYNSDMLICEMFVNEPGHLKNVGGINNVVRDEVRMLRLRGRMAEDGSGLEALRGCKIPLVNFAGLTVYPTDFSVFASDKVEYIALPKGCTIKDQIVMKENCPNLKAVGLIEKADTGGENDCRFRYRSFVPGSAKIVVTMTVDPGVPSAAPVSNENGGSEAAGQADAVNNLVYNITEVTMKGLLNMSDISNQNNYIDNQGHYDSSITGGESGALGSFTTKLVGNEDNVLISNVESTLALAKADFTEALFGSEDESGNFTEHSEDLTLSKAGPFNNCTEIWLPVDHRQTTIPKEAFSNAFGNLTSLCIPGNIKTIGEGAFEGCDMSPHITTTGVDENKDGFYVDNDGKSAIIDNGPRTVTLPKELRTIETRAFHLDNDITDVYPLALDAPTCARDAFRSTSYTGNNSFENKEGDVISRESYVHPGVGNCYAVLHYPIGVTEDQAKKYTDITRKYTLYDTQGDTDGNGNLKMWPSQADWNFASVLAETGYTWEAVDKSVNEWNYNTIDGKESEFAAKVTDTSKTFYTDYTGWHQFTLVNTVYTGGQDVVRFDATRFKQNDWYSICVPYDLHKSDLLAIFGAPGETDAENKYPDVCTLVGVKRDKSKGRITLTMSRDLVNTDVKIETENGETAVTYIEYNADETDPVIMHAGYPYLIHPWLPEAELGLANAGKRVVNIKKGISAREAVMLPYTDHKIIATDENKKSLNGKEGREKWEYQFIGHYYSDKDIPAYTYFIGRSKSQGKNIWFYNPDNTAKIAWPQYVAVIFANASVKTKVPTAYEAKLNGTNPGIYFEGEADGETNDGKPKSDDFTTGTGTGAKSYQMVFDTDGSETTGISDIGADEADGFRADGKVYNISGQYVGNSLSGLSKGIYIVNGKKYVVE